MIIQMKMDNLEKQVRDGLLEVQENTFQELKFKWSKREELFHQMQMKVFMLETIVLEKLKSNTNNLIIYRIKGKTYLLEAHESLWEKHLPDNVELLV